MSQNAFYPGMKITDFSELVEFTREEYQKGINVKGLLSQSKDKFFHLVPSTSVKTHGESILVCSNDFILKNVITIVNTNEKSYNEQIRIFDINFGNAYSFNEDVKLWTGWHNEGIIMSKHNDNGELKMMINRFMFPSLNKHSNRKFSNWVRFAIFDMNLEIKKTIIYSITILISVIIFSFVYSYSNRYQHIKGNFFYDKWNHKVITVYNQ